MRVSKKKQKGFTLVELLVVVAIIAVLAAILLPRFLGYTDNAREARAMKDVRNFVTVIDAFAAMGGNYPEPSLDIDNPRSIASVMQSKGIKWTGDDNGVVDPWENPYYYDLVDDYYCIASPGKDGVLNTADDICNIGKVCKTASGLDENAIPSASGGNPVKLPAANEEDFIFDPETGSIIGYVGEGGDVVIPDAIDGVEVACIGSNAFRNCSSLTGVTIPDSVTTIGSGAFYNCTNLYNVEFEGYVNNIAFDYSSPTLVGVFGKTNITEFTFKPGTTKVPENMFYGCNSLVSVNIPDSVTEIEGRAFYNCINLASVVIPDSVTSVGHSAFYGCNGLINVDLPNSLIIIGSNAFRNCSSLTGVTIPDSVTTIGSSAFNGCSSLTEITIPDNVIEIKKYAFRDCTSLSSITIQNPDTVIHDSQYTIPSQAVIIGHDPSTAKTYAEKYNRTFETL